MFFNFIIGNNNYFWASLKDWFQIMKFNRLLYEDMPLAHITITWVIANIVLSIIHSPKVAMNIILEMSYLFGIISFLVCLIISNKIFQLLEKIKKLRVNFN